MTACRGLPAEADTPNYATLRLQRPTLAIFALQVLVRRIQVGDLASFAVVADQLALPGAHRHYAQQHCLGQTSGIFERASRLLGALDGVSPIHAVFGLRLHAG